MNSIFLSVIIPAYNEEARLGPTLEKNLRYLLAQNYTWEILVVSDGSKDKTEDVVREFEKINSNIKLIAYAKNRGKGYAVKTGMLSAKGDLRLFMDADNSTPIEELGKLLKFIKPQSSFDVVIGSLALPGAEINKKEFILRVIAGWLGNALIQLLVLPGIKDTQRGFKLFTKQATEKIFSKTKIERWGFDIEVLALARQLGFTIKEIAVHWSHDARSKISAWAYFQVLGEVLKIRYWLSSGSYGPTLNPKRYTSSSLRLSEPNGLNPHVHYCKQFIPQNGEVLDVGSGRGKFLLAMASLGFKVYGVEVSSPYIKEAQALAMANGVFVDIIQGKAEALPFPSNKFDFVNCAEVSEHVDDPIMMCREIFRVLKHGSKSYISFHNRYGFFDYHYSMPLINWMPRFLAEKIAALFNRSKLDSKEIGRQSLSSMHYYTFSKAKNILQNIGFKVADIRIEKIKNKFGIFAPAAILFYYLIARPFYFNTFHFLIEK